MRKALVTGIAALAVFASPAIRAEDHTGHNHETGNEEAKGHEGHEGHDHAKGHDAGKGHAEHTVLRKLEIKGVALMEFAHDQKCGKVTLSVMNEKKAALTPDKAPRINLIVGHKRKQLKTVVVKGETAKFTVSDASLKAALNGKVAIKIGDRSYQVVIDPHFGHNHGPGGHHH